MGDAERESKICAICGRRFTWRKAWARQWETIRTCSAACRRRRLQPVDAQLEAAIMALLQQRGRGKTICPSEASRAVWGAEAGNGPAAMARTREAARRLAACDTIVITQRGVVVDPSTAKGPIRLKLGK